MTPAELLRELALIAVVMVGWTALVMLMLERDRKREERYRKADHHTADSSGAEIPPPPQTKAGASTPAQEE